MPRIKGNKKPSSEKNKALEPVKKNKLAEQKVSRKSAPVTTGVKQPQKRKSRPGQAALRQIKKYQKSTQLLIQRAPFQRRIRQIANEYSLINHDQLNAPDRKGGFRFQPEALNAIQQAVQASIVSLYEDANLCVYHAGRVTLFDRDILLARRIRGESSF